MTIVGRQQEIELVERFLDTSTPGPRRLLLHGDPGVGKTTLWEAGVESARARGHRVLVSRPSEADAALSYSGLTDLLVDIEEDAFAPLPGPQRTALEIALLRTSPSGTPLDQRAVFAGFQTLISAFAAEKPLMIAVDDLHWLDGPSARSVEYALRRVAAPVLFFASARPQPTWVDEQDRLRLDPLTAAALYKLIQNRLGVDLSRTTLLRLHEACGGNAFFALEMTRALVAQHTLDVPDAWPLTDDMRELVASYLETLSDSVRDALLLVSAASQPTRDLIGSDALIAAEGAGLVRIDHLGRIRFAHPLYASAIYLGASPESRKRAHASLAAGAEPLERARHLALASDGVSEEVAAALEEAALIALGRGAPETAAELQERASELTPRDATAVSAGRALHAAGLYLQAGDPAKATRLLDCLPATDAHVLHLRALIRFREERFEDAISLLHGAAAQAREPALQAAIQLDLALAGISTNFDHEPARADAVLAVEHATRTGDDGLLAATLAVKTMTEFLLGDGVDEEQLARAVELQQDRGRRRVETWPTLIAGLLGFFTGRVDVAYSLLYPLRQEMLDHGEEAEVPILSINLAWLELLTGNTAQARMLSDEALELSALSQTMEAHAHAFAALLDAHVGDEERCRAHVAAAREASGGAGYCLVIQWISIALGLLELPLGNMAEVDRELEFVTRHFENHDIVEPIHLTVLPDKIEALVALGDHERAERLTDLLRRSGAHHHRPAAVAAAERSLAVVLAARGDLAGAHDAVQRALVHYEIAPLPLEIARTLIVKGQLERRRKQRGAAAASLQQALATCEQIGATLWAAFARAELARTGNVRTEDELTPSEARVAELAAGGLTNREIATAAFMSQKTVEANLSRIYRKLGIRSRAELGVRLTQ